MPVPSYGVSGGSIPADTPDQILTTQGDVMTHDGSSAIRLAAGTSGHFLKTQGSGANPVWAAQSANTDGGGGHITLLPINANGATQGTWVHLEDENTFMDSQFYNNTHDDADQVDFKVYLSAGTYTIKLVYNKGTNAGIIKVQIDGTDKLTADGYNGSSTYANVATQASVAVATSGVATISVKCDGKHGSSSDHYVMISAIEIYRTA